MFVISSQQSCGFARLPHDCLAAAVQTLLLSFATVQLQIPYDPRDRRASIALLLCNVYDLIGPVWTFVKLSAICLRHSARQNERTIDVKRAVSVVFELLSGLILFTSK